MVASKKCRVCTSLDVENIPISGDCYNKSLPDLVEKISGITLEPRKANGVLICKLCAIQLVHTDLFIDKLRSTLTRLKKIARQTKPKTHCKDLTEDSPKLKYKNNSLKGSSEFLDCLDSLVKREEEGEASKSLTIPTKIQGESKTNTPKGVIRRKSVLQSNNEENNIQNGDTEIIVSATQLKRVLDIDLMANNIDPNLNDENKKVEQKIKTPKKALTRKSTSSENNLSYHKNYLENCDKVNNISMTKFKKIADTEITPVNAKQGKAGKRKEILNENGIECESKDLKQAEICEHTPIKRNKTQSISGLEDNYINLATDEHNFTESLSEDKIKILNCVICGKGFNQKIYLRVHIESAHMGEKLKQCPNCLTEFWSQQKYESHVFSEKCKNSKHPCQYPKCNRRFKTVRKMELHIKEKHFSSQQEPEAE